MALHSKSEADEFLARVAAGFTPRWWEEQIETWLCGVFEGGGAKGAAYGPALRAFRDEGCWFKSVAGASAGAITAALVAAGFTPEAMAECTLEALSRLSSRSVRLQALAGWSRLRSDPPHIASNARLSELLE